jgi:acyl carrier protein
MKELLMTSYERLREILVSDYNVLPEKLALDAHLEELGIDSLGMMELLFKVEDEFHIQLPSNQVELATVEDVVRYIDRLMLEQTAAVAASRAST